VSARPVVGWYVHHHGAGHVTRLLAVRPHLDADVVVFSSLAAPSDLPDATTWVLLPRDDHDVVGVDGVARAPGDPASGADPTVRGLLHWAPLHHDGHSGRLAAIAAWVAHARPRAFVVDVSVEVTLLVRLFGVPPVVVAQPGDRSDAPHALGWDAAERVLAPWAEGLHDSPALDRVRDRVRWVGGVSRHDGRVDGPERPEPGSVLVLAGGGAEGRAGLARRVAEAAAATPSARWSVLGDSADSWVDDPWPFLRAAEVVVSAAGQNSVADLAAASARAVVLPQQRPFDEQRTTALLLAARGLAVVPGAGSDDESAGGALRGLEDAPSGDAWPAPPAWPELLARARALRPGWDLWQVEGAAARAAAVVAEVAR
jgi:hypothetical protein